MYEAGTYVVSFETFNGEYNRIETVFNTEEDARACANMQWKRKDVCYVRISKRGFHHHRRNAVVVAEAHK